MSKNIKKLLTLAGVIIAIVVLIFADKSFKEKQAKNSTYESESTEPVENMFEDKLNGDSKEQ